MIIFIVGQDFVVKGDSTLIVQPNAQIHISGDLSLETNSTVEVSTESPPIDIKGCANFSGTLSINLTKSDVSSTTVPITIFSFVFWGDW
jgi:hypothetical protein